MLQTKSSVLVKNNNGFASRPRTNIFSFLLAGEYFNTNVRGWSVDEKTDTNYYKVIEVGMRSFATPRDYLHPIKTSELITNPNLIQNPQW